MPPRRVAHDAVMNIDSSEDDMHETELPSKPKESHYLTDTEPDYDLDLLISRQADFMSGNGVKGKGYTELATALNTEFPDCPKRTAKSVESRISYIKTTYQKYEFIRRKTGAGWDDSRKCPDNEDPVYIDSFVAQYGDKYKAYFGKSFIYYDRASKLFGRNSATGDNVYHPKKARKKSVEKSTDNPAKPSTKSRPRGSTTHLNTRQPLSALENSAIDLASNDSLPPMPAAGGSATV